MLVRLVIDCTGPNPDFLPDRPVQRGKNWPERVLPAGTEIEDRNAWYLCIPKGEFPAQAEPVDDEAKARVAEALEKQARILEHRENLRKEEEQAKKDAAKKSRKQKVAPL